MRRAHCRKCWQANRIFAKQCVHCGDSDGLRLANGVAELAAYLAAGATAIGLAIWAALILF